MINESYKEFATERQAEYIDAFNESGGIAAAAAVKLGVDSSTIRHAIAAVKKKAAARGYSPDHDQIYPVPEGQIAKGVSTLYDQEGNVKMQWVKSQAQVNDLRETAEQIVAGLDVGSSKPIKPPINNIEHLLTVYPMGDPHIGMYSWHEETGDDFDCEIAERDLCGAIESLVETAQPTEKAVIVNLGDFFHADNQAGITARGGNVLDVDTRQQRVTRIGVRIMVHLIETALKKHQEVTVINEVGNHDDESSFTLSLILDAWFRNNPRVTINLSPATFHYYQFGKVMLGVTHGHNCKPDYLGQVMAADMPKEWGETEFRYWLVGHVHHSSKKEVPGVVVETFRTLAAKDAWHSSKGYRSGRDMNRITYHKDYGEVGREIIGIKQIKANQVR